MLGWALAFLVIALIAGVFGFGGIRQYRADTLPHLYRALHHRDHHARGERAAAALIARGQAIIEAPVGDGGCFRLSGRT